MKTAIFSIKPYELEPLKRFSRDTGHDLSYFEQRLDANSVHMAEGMTAVSIAMHDDVSAEVLSALSKYGVRLVTLRCAGYDNVNTIAAVAENITLMRVPAYAPQAVAEHAVALMLALARKVHLAYNRTRNNNFKLDGLMGMTIYKKTIGVIGTGKIGSAFCQIMIGFGCKVVAFDITESTSLKKIGVVYKTLDQLLHEADVVSIHCPLTRETKGMMGEKEFEKMRKGAILINTARGAVLNTDAAIASLKSGKLGALGIDVYEGESELFFKDWSNNIVLDDKIERLLTLPNVVVTPHQAFFTSEAIEEICAITVQNLTSFENGAPTENEI